MLDLRLIFTVRCQEASRIHSDGLDRPLTRSERWALRAHRLICQSCRHAHRQLRMVQELVMVMPGDWRDRMQQPVVQLSPERRARIKQALVEASRPDLG